MVIKDQIEEYLKDNALELNEGNLVHGYNVLLSSEIEIDGIPYYVDYSCRWIHNEAPGTDEFEIEIETIVLLGEVDELIFDVHGILSVIGEINLN